MCVESQPDLPPFAEWSVFSFTMIQLYADWLVQLMDQLRSLETRAQKWARENTRPDLANEVVSKMLSGAVNNINYLQLRSAYKQMARIRQRVATGNCLTGEFAGLIKELRVRIIEDLGDRVFFCIADPMKIERFFKLEEGALPSMILLPKKPDEFFDRQIAERFPSSYDDLDEFSRCYVASCYTAAVFHLMRVVEIGVMELADLVGLADPKPSWGSVLSKVDVYAHKTEYKDLPPNLKPHQELLRSLSAEMHAIQRAWRNKMTHIDNKLIPAKGINNSIAFEIMTAVECFMRSLAERLPPKVV